VLNRKVRVKNPQLLIAKTVVAHLKKDHLTFDQHIANYVTGNWTTSDLPKIGLAGLQQGLDTESLTILAGMSDKDNAFELESYFTRSLDELNIRLPDIRQAALDLALYYTDEILAGRLDPIDGVNKIIRRCLDKYDFFNESRDFAMDSIDFQTVYGLYWTYDDLLEADRPWDKSKTNEVLMQETKSDIIEELKKWKEKNKNALQQRI